MDCLPFYEHDRVRCHHVLPMTQEGHIIEPPAESLEALPEAEETVEGLPVLAEVRALDRPSPATLPAVQAAAAMATGFVAGAATIALVKRHSARRPSRAVRSAPRRAVDMLPIVASRTFLVDIHLIAKPEE
jgi:hypothetical protein